MSEVYIYVFLAECFSFCITLYVRSFVQHFCPALKVKVLYLFGFHVQVFQYLTFKCLYCKICRIPLRRSRFSKTRPVSPSGQDGLERPENGKRSVVYLSQFIFGRKSALLVEPTSAARINKVGTERGERRSAVSSPIQRRTG